VKKIAILGGGSWGTALAIALTRSRREHSLALWVHDANLTARMRDSRENSVYLPGFEIPRRIEITNDLKKAVRDAAVVIGVMPAAHAREIYAAALPHALPGVIVASATKGIEQHSLLRMSQVIADVSSQQKVAVGVATLSGPSFALEVARGDPTAIAVASQSAEAAAELQEQFSGASLRLYTNEDVIGVELGGALKNIIAIAAGVCAGLGFGSNTIATLTTRGLAEMTRLSLALGGRRETLAGLAGMGDLVLTCTGQLSRNRALGEELGRGRALEEIQASTRMVAEGVGTTAAAYELARESGVEMPITEQVHALLYEGRAPRDAIRDLMERKLKSE
jgi:glycerol-3-phosphate dehydrogenase (NAD(P)+)